MPGTVYDSLSSPFLALLAFLLALLGLTFGSFASVLITRIPTGESLWTRSKCRYCERQVLAKENIPIVSYMVLRAKCKGCGTRISALYLILEIIMGIFFVSSIFIFHSWIEVLLWLIIAALGLPLVVIDLQKHRLPDPLTASFFTTSSIVILTSSIINSRFDRLIPSLIGSASLVAFYLAVMFISKGGMGMGDVKLSASIGLISGYFGVKAVLISCFSAYALGSVLGIALIVFGKAGRKTAIPFGPFMIVGQVVSLITISHSLL